MNPSNSDSSLENSVAQNISEDNIEVLSAHSQDQEFAAQFKGIDFSHTKSSIEHILSSENYFLGQGQIRLFIAKKNGVAAGRVAAFIDYTFKSRVGLLGLFECLNDPALAKQLLNSAEKWLVEQGIHTSLGPIDQNIFNNYRFKIKGFELPSFLGEPENPEYYPKLWESAGYSIYKKWRSWDINSWKMLIWRFYFYFSKFTTSRLNKDGYYLHKLDPNQFEKEQNILYKLIMDIFAENSAFSKIPLSEYLRLNKDIKNNSNVHGFLLFHKSSSIPIGFSYCLLDQAHQTLLLHSFGIKKKYRHLGLAKILLSPILPIYDGHKDSIQSTIAALVKDGPSTFSVTGSARRVYALYSKTIA